MTFEMSFELNVGKGKVRTEAMEVVKTALKEKGFEAFADDLRMEKKSDSPITNWLDITLKEEEFEEAVAVVYTALINELPEINFNGYICYMCGAYDFGYCFEKNGNELYTSILAGDGNGCCPECGEEITHLDEFDPNKTYICPDCGEEIPNYYLFDEYRNEEHTYEIINDELVEK